MFHSIFPIFPKLTIILYTSRVKIIMLTFGPHANSKTFFQPTLLALPPHVHVDLAIVAVLALVHRIFGNTPPKESFASFACERVVMVTGRSITAHQAQLFGRSVVQHAASCYSRSRSCSSSTGTRGVNACTAVNRIVVEFFLFQPVGMTADTGQNAVRRGQLFFN